MAQLREQERQAKELAEQRADEAFAQLERERQLPQALEALLREKGIDLEE